jgi:hypothetical protein
MVMASRMRGNGEKPSEQHTVDPTQMRSTAWRTLPKNVELMSQYQDFEAVAQYTDQQEADCNHAGSDRRLAVADEVNKRR